MSKVRTDPDGPPMHETTVAATKLIVITVARNHGRRRDRCDADFKDRSYSPTAQLIVEGDGFLRQPVKRESLISKYSYREQCHLSGRPKPTHLFDASPKCRRPKFVPAL